MGEELNQVIDKVAEKIGVAVEAAGPIAETMVRETATLGMAGVIAGVILFALGYLSVFGVLVHVQSKDNSDDMDTMLPVAIGAIVLLVVGIVAIARSVPLWLAPTCHIVESLK